MKLTGTLVAKVEDQAGKRISLILSDKKQIQLPVDDFPEGFKIGAEIIITIEVGMTYGS